MDEHLLSISEAADYLGIGERKIKELVNKGRIPAYKIGGAFLRFKKSQLDIIRQSLYKETTKTKKPDQEIKSAHAEVDRLKDFLYFNDFYILSIIIIVIAVVLMIAT